jgi:hypothetical protein
VPAYPLLWSRQHYPRQCSSPYSELIIHNTPSLLGLHCVIALQLTRPITTKFVNLSPIISHCVGSSVAYDLIPESYLGCLGLVECPDLRPLQPALPRPSRQVHLSPHSLPACRPAILQARNLSIDGIYLHLMSGVLVLNQDPTDSKASPHVRHLGVEP